MEEDITRALQGTRVPARTASDLNPRNYDKVEEWRQWTLGSLHDLCGSRVLSLDLTVLRAAEGWSLHRMTSENDVPKTADQRIASSDSRRAFLWNAAAMSGAILIPNRLAGAQVTAADTGPQDTERVSAMRFPSAEREKEWEHYSFNIDHWWGDFSRDLPNEMDMFGDNPWAIGPFTKFGSNPVLSPTPGAWDQGAFFGGVHNGSMLIKDNIFYYIYRGHRPIDIPQTTKIDYICDIGVATSSDGIYFRKDSEHSPFFRKGEDQKYSYEDVNVVRFGDTYYLFCNQWLWGQQNETRINGVFLATSHDLLKWTKIGIVFPGAKEIHRNGIVLQDPHNEAVRVNGKFVMYINNGIVAYSEDMLHWESHKNPNRWPGGEGCFALANHSSDRPNDIIHFTGGPHTGHFYAVGEVLLSKDDPEKPLGWLPRSPLFAEAKYRFENGFSVDPPHRLVSRFADCIFFNALTQHNGKWWLYYGPANYYTCLATAPVRRLQSSEHA